MSDDTKNPPPTLHIEDRPPRLGERGWMICEDDTPEQWLRDVFEGTEQENDQPAYGWPVLTVDQEAAERRRHKHDGRWMKSITVVYTPPLTEEAIQTLNEYRRGDRFVAILAEEAGTAAVLRARKRYLAEMESDDEGERYLCHCCGTSFHSTKRPDPERDFGYGTCTRCHDFVATGWAKHGFPGDRPITKEQALARLAQYA